MGSFETHGWQTRSVYPLILCSWQKQSCWYTELENFNNVSQVGPFIPQWSSGGSFALGWGSYLFMLRTPAALTEVLPRLVLGLLMPFWPECILGTERKWERGENVSSVILQLQTNWKGTCNALWDCVIWLFTPSIYVKLLCSIGTLSSPYDIRNGVFFIHFLIRICCLIFLWKPWNNCFKIFQLIERSKVHIWNIINYN